MCFKSKNIYNFANYIIRQEFINKGNWIRYNQLFALVKDSEPYKDMGSNTGQATLRLLDKNWKSFFIAIKDWKENPSKYLGRPKLPKYKPKDGRFILSIDNNKVMLKDGYIYFAWKPLKVLNNRFITKINQDNKIVQCRFVPRCSKYIMEVVYEKEIIEQQGKSERIISIDLGVNNFVTITNNVELKPLVTKGGVIKSVNQYYNKEKAKIQSELKKINKKDWSNKLQKLTNKRNNKIKYLMHVYSKKIVDYCKENEIDTIVCEYNKEWKQESKLSSKTNQHFIGIPYLMFVNQLAYKCENVGIKFIVHEESYTSGTSFLDGEIPCKENYDKSRRIQRGLFQNTNSLINSDVNGSLQIMRKVFSNTIGYEVEGILNPIVINVAKFAM